MTTTLERPTALKCACAKGHPNGEPCHAGCGCECHGCRCGSSQRSALQIKAPASPERGAPAG